MGERLDALSKRWEESQALQLVTPVVCIAWETRATAVPMAASLRDARATHV